MTTASVGRKRPCRRLAVAALAQKIEEHADGDSQDGNQSDEGEGWDQLVRGHCCLPIGIRKQSGFGQTLHWTIRSLQKG